VFTLILFLITTPTVPANGPPSFRIEKIHGFATVKDCERAAVAAHESLSERNYIRVNTVCVKELGK
jgi:hypothetical protein